MAVFFKAKWDELIAINEASPTTVNVYKKQKSDSVDNCTHNDNTIH